MSYKIDPEKGFRILRSVSPPIIFINGSFASGKTWFSNKFKEEGYSVFKLTENNVQDFLKYLQDRKNKKMDHNSLIIESNMPDEKKISDLFSGELHNFTYVYIYPNNSKRYLDRINARISDFKSQNQSNSEFNPNDKYKNNKFQISFPNSQSHLMELIETPDKLVIELMKLNKEIYSRHLQEFDDKILTVLI